MKPHEKDLLRSKILIVDDEPNNVLLLEQMLEEEDFSEVYSTINPEEVALLHEEKDFDLILLDYKMPRMNGVQVIHALNQVVGDNYLPVLILTAQTDDDIRIASLRAGAKDFLSKPIKTWEVLLRIRNLLETGLFYKQQKLRANEMEERVRQRTRKLHDTRLAIIRRLGRAGEYRDNETGMHVIRMSKSSQRLALAAGLGETHAEKILQSSPMHDVGKIGIPDSILLKPGKLDPDEFEVMKTHAMIGADIIGDFDSDLLQMARRIACTHHEKWDGSGYPNNLKAEEIPIEGRISAICDVFDALTSERPYKKAWSTEKAMELIKQESGKHFDPELVLLFNKILPEILIIKEKYCEDAKDSIRDELDRETSTARLIFKDSYLIGNDIIDEDHRELFKIINSVHDAIVDDEDELCIRHFKSLQKVATDHFKREEKILEESGFVGASKHSDFHQQLLQKTAAIASGCSNMENKEELLRRFDEVISFFVNDLIKGDRGFVSHLRASGFLHERRRS